MAVIEDTEKKDDMQPVYDNHTDAAAVPVQENPVHTDAEWNNPHDKDLRDSEAAYYGYKPRTREEIMSGYDEDKHGATVRYLQNLMAKPEERLTPEQQRKVRMMSGISDGLAGLAEMFAHGRGAYIRNRDTNTNQKTTNQRLEEWRARYENDLDRYNGIMANAHNQDVNNYLTGETANDQLEWGKVQNRYQNAYRQYNAAEAQHAAEQAQEAKQAANLAYLAAKQRGESELTAQKIAGQIAVAKTRGEIQKILKSIGGGGVNPKSGSYDFYDGSHYVSFGNSQQGRNAAYELYGTLTSAGVLPKLMDYTTGKEITSPTAIASYVSQNISKLRDDDWADLQNRSQQKVYTTAPAEKTQKSKISHGTAR